MSILLNRKKINQTLLASVLILGGSYSTIMTVSATPEKSSASPDVWLTAPGNNMSRTYYKVFVDVGHGGKDPGAIKHGVRESDLNLSIAKKVESYLKQKDINVALSRKSDIYHTIDQRIIASNKYGADAFISIHNNAASSSSAHGIESFYTPGSSKAEAFTKEIQSTLISYTKAHNRGSHPEEYWVIEDSKIPAALLETGFMTNPTELAKLKTSSYQDTLARAIGDGIFDYLTESIDVKDSSVISEAYTSVQGANIRSGDSTSHHVIGKLDFGVVVEVLEVESDTGWYKIKYGDSYGFTSPSNINTSGVMAPAVSGTKPSTPSTPIQKPQTPSTKPETSTPTPEAPKVIATGTVVNAPTLNVRSGASTSHSKIGSLKQGQKVEITKVMSNGWYQIKFNDGVGYVSNAYIKKDAASNVIATGTVVNASTLNVRSGASTSHSKIGSLKQGQKVEITKVMSNGWYQIKFNGGVGYVSNAYIKKNAKQSSNQTTETFTSTKTGTVVDASTLNVRSGASTSHNKVGSLKEGQTVAILKTMDNGWYQIKFKNTSAYVSNEYIKTETLEVAPESSSNSSSTSITGTVVNASILNVRSGASTSHNKLGLLEEGQTVEVLNTMDNGWYQIKFNNKTGYVSDEYIKLPNTLGTVTNASILNVRSGDSTGHTKIGTLKEGQKVEILKTMSNGWYQIKYNNKIGYVSSDYIKK